MLRVTHFKLVPFCAIFGLLITFLVPIQVRAQSAVESPLASGALPRTDGTTIVWINNPATYAAGDVYAARLDDRRPAPSVTRPADHVDIDHGVVVWTENRRCRNLQCFTAVYGKELASGREFTIDVEESTEQHVYTFSLAISGDYVIWLRNVGGRQTIRGRNIVTMAPAFTVAQPDPIGMIYGVKLSGDRVVWGEQVATDVNVWRWRVLTLQIGDDRPTVIAEGSSGLGVFSYDFAGDTVAYTTPDGFLYTVDLKTGQRGLIAARAVTPTTDGRYLVWEDAGGAAPVQAERIDLRAHDLALDIDFPVAINLGRNRFPQVKGGALVWQRGPNEQAAVHALRVAELLPPARRPASATTNPNAQYFVETGHTLAWTFKEFWQRSGGLPVFGYPLTEEFDEVNRDTGKRFTVQYVERQRYEYHPENANTPYTVLLGRLGVEELQRQGRDWQTFPKAAPNAPHYFAATGHAIAPQFYDYWRTHGLEFGDRGVTEREALALFGYPISEPQMEKNSSGDMVLTQWFERARFEYHPNNPEPYKVLLGRLAADLLATRGW